MKCDWCNKIGKVIGDAKSFPGSKIVKCDACHYEWEIIQPSKTTKLGQGLIKALKEAVSYHKGEMKLRETKRRKK